MDARDFEALLVTCPICESKPQRRCYSEVTGFRRGEPGPWGPSHAVSFEVSSHRRERKNLHPERWGYFVGLRDGRAKAVEAMQKTLVELSPTVGEILSKRDKEKKTA